MKRLALFVLPLITALLVRIPSQVQAATPAVFQGDYYSNMSLSGSPVLTRNNENIDFDWVAGSPHASIPINNFSARWTATVSFTAGNYIFETTSDDGVRLFIDDTIVINRWVDQGPTNYSAIVPLTAGNHTIKYEYYENGGGAVAKLNWAEVVPQNNSGLRIMPLGDSITDGYNVPGGYRIKLAQLLDNENFVGSQQNGPIQLTDKDHEGYPGWLISQIAANVNNWLAVQQPDMVLLKIGTNDMGQDSIWDTAPDRLSDLIDQISAQRPTADILVSNLIPLAPNNQRVQTFNSALPDMITTKRQQGKKVHFVDMYSALNFSDLADGVHPNQVGYDKMADTWAAAINAVLNGQTPTPTPTPTPNSTPNPSEAYFVGEYFSNTNLSGNPTFVRQDTQINFDWVGGSPDSSVPNDNFSARWTKPHTFEDGLYRFTMRGDDGIRLRIDGQTVIDKWIDQGPTTYTHDMQMTAGQHQVVMEYYEKGGGAVAQLSWIKLASATPTPTPTPTPLPPGDGYQAQYYTNLDLSGSPVLTRNEAEINNQWVDGSPHASVPNDNFSARWNKTHTFEGGNHKFTVTGDDGIRLFIDNQLIIDQWKDQAPSTYSTERVLTAGNHEIKVEYYEKGGGATMQFTFVKLSDVTPTSTPTPSPTPLPVGTGFLSEFFTNVTLSGSPTHSREDSVIDFDWGTGTPHSSIPVDNFSARFTKNHSFTAGNYRFSVTADDGVRLYIDDQLVIDKWIDQPATTYTHDMLLSNGLHEVRMEYYEKGMGAVAKLDWTSL